MGGGHGPAPPAERLVLPPEGDPYPPESEWLDEYNGKPLTDYPEEYKKGLKAKLWYNYQDVPATKFLPTAEENLKMWQDIYIEKAIDGMPAYEIHAKDLPDYHFWPMIQNDVEPKFTGQCSTLLQYQYHSDQCEIPRFSKHGVPKTPRQEQVWYVPLGEDGRCDWRAVMARWAGYDSWFSNKGWNDRYIRWVYQDTLFQWRTSVKLLNTHRPIWFKHHEINRVDRSFRHRKYGSRIATPMYCWAFYFWLIGGVGASYATYTDLVWNDEPWNYDMHYAKHFRDHGSYHPPI